MNDAKQQLNTGDQALAKLIQLSSSDDGIAVLVDRALNALPWRTNEDIAAKLLFSILLHDDLAEALNAGLDTTLPRVDENRAGHLVYVPMRRR